MDNWRDIPGYEGLYRVSSAGQVQRCDGLPMTPSTPRHSREYASVGLRREGVRRRHSVHRLVALAFIGKPPFEGAQIRHLDGNHLNNAVGNLAWGSAKENTADRRRHGTMATGERHGLFGKGIPGERNGNARLTSAVVLRIREMAKTMNNCAIGRELGVDHSLVWKVVNGKAWTHV